MATNNQKDYIDDLLSKLYRDLSDYDIEDID